MQNRFKLIGKERPKEPLGPTPKKAGEEIILRLTRDEADTLLALVGFCAGPYEGRRGHTYRIWEKLGSHRRWEEVKGRIKVEIEGREIIRFE